MRKVKRAILAGFELFSDQKFKVKRADLTTLEPDTLSKQGYSCARATSDRNEVSQHEEVRVWIPDGRSYMDVKQHSIQNFSFIVRAARLALSVRPRMAEPDPTQATWKYYKSTLIKTETKFRSTRK
ncbi:hypothetical protein C1E24_04630 [Pseudoalteromonas phenolica]|uniref:Uncharacterized protein n=1 Tax=Pseudoalteromonas phenolica TaxID=161398 RepID=A0A5R9Q4K0_9GAMM|nr:hypothetical protein C1E24_04630 [Pseudoalteromonas phenolica]